MCLLWNTIHSGWVVCRLASQHSHSVFSGTRVAWLSCKAGYPGEWIARLPSFSSGVHWMTGFCRGLVGGLVMATNSRLESSHMQHELGSNSPARNLVPMCCFSWIPCLISDVCLDRAGLADSRSLHQVHRRTPPLSNQSERGWNSFNDLISSSWNRAE